MAGLHARPFLPLGPAFSPGPAFPALKPAFDIQPVKKQKPRCKVFVKYGFNMADKRKYTKL